MSVGRTNKQSKNTTIPNSINKARILSPKVLSEYDLFLSAKSRFIVKNRQKEWFRNSQYCRPKFRPKRYLDCFL